MSGVNNNRIRILYVKKILEQMTDEDHPMNTTEIIKHLNAYGIECERKTLYGDIEALKTVGVDIESNPAKNSGYYVASRDFELAELKLLVDSVQSSKFITHKKSLELIKKIEGLSNIYDSRELNRQVYVKNRIKSMNESIYYNVDKIHNAIDQNSDIRFKYFEYDIKGNRVFKKNGVKYEISPHALTWDDENYYMIGYDKEAGIIKHYRVDKMMEIELNGKSRSGTECFEKMDMSKYTNTLFSMFGGEICNVTMRFANSLSGVVIDRFGKQVMMIPDGDGHFKINVDLAVSPHFFAWIFGLGNKARIISPEKVVKQMKGYIDEIGKMY